MKFNFLGTEFEISFLFLAMTAVMVLFDKTGELALFFGAALIHEAAHFLMMWFFGCRPKAIRLIPGGINIEENSPKLVYADIMILLAGPFSNLCCFLIFKGSFSLINLLLFIYNMLPFDRLDGGSILYLCLSRLFSVRAAENAIKFSTLIAVLLLWGLFVYLLFCGVINYSLLIFSLYLISGMILKKVVERKG
ncbi:MAG: hypothetical protein J6V50_04550 [Clostridia bacterium]|nr:hypothetical protein [Clostridia bacterium]